MRRRLFRGAPKTTAAAGAMRTGVQMQKVAHDAKRSGGKRWPVVVVYTVKRVLKKRSL
jgi:hypothetical protein